MDIEFGLNVFVATKNFISHIINLAPLRFNAVLCRQLTASNINEKYPPLQFYK